MSEAEQIKLLLDALIHFKSQITTATFSNMGFFVITLGWLLTSGESRKFLANHKVCTNMFIILLSGVCFGFIIFTAKIYMNTLNIANTLIGFEGVEESLYEHYMINIVQVIIYDIFEILVYFMVVRVLLSIKKTQPS